jgi:two-component system phosphate regulon sensor histidine kinase PhoR
VSHELKTPLSVIKACIETLIDGAVEDVEIRKPFLEQIAEQGERLHLLILDLISLARIESGEEAMDFQAVSLEQAIAECLDRHQPRAEAKKQRLTSSLPANSPVVSVWADEEALGQILDNLVDNALKYTPEGGSIEVRWQANGTFVSLQVEDTGPGIPERDLPRIFERFYRVDKARSRELGGTGLGLAIVKHLTQVMKGTVKATSQVSKGTTFTVTLPKVG